MPLLNLSLRTFVISMDLSCPRGRQHVAIHLRSSLRTADTLRSNSTQIQFEWGHPLANPSRMGQLDFFPTSKRRKEHGGAHSVGRRRSRRPLSTKHSLHVTLRSELAVGARSLLKHRDIIDRVLKINLSRYRISLYRIAVCGNHVHLLLRGKDREQIQNFFRVFAGHVAQRILQRLPLAPSESPTDSGCAKNQRRFWKLLIYSRIVSWGREFKTVARYIHQNILESLFLVAYTVRKRRSSDPPRGKPSFSPTR